MAQLKHHFNTLLRLTTKLIIPRRNFETQASYNTQPYKLHLLKEGPAAKIVLTREDSLAHFREMVMLRNMEASAAQLYREKIIRGFCHLYSGEEAVAVGLKAAMRPEDAVITSYRAHAFTYLMGVPIFNLLSELAGMSTGCSRGKGGSMHMYARGFYGGNGIVGAQVPLGLGISFALKYKGSKGLCFALYGDGASNQGQVFESFNIAKLWNIPCIFVCENNMYGMGTSVIRSSAMTEMYKRGQYIPGIEMDAMDILTVRECARFAIDYCTKTQSPIVIEATTYRYYGHSMSDPGTSYRENSEVKEVRVNRDPLITFREKILAGNLASAAELADIKKEAKATLQKEIAKVKARKETDMSDLTSDIYCDNKHDAIRGITPFEYHIHKRIGQPFAGSEPAEELNYE